MESVTIGGIKGVITIEQESYVSAEWQYFFTREAAGNEQAVPAGTPVVTAGSENYLDFIPVIFMGQNGGYETVGELIAQQRSIINHQSPQRAEQFIIIGLHTDTAEHRAELEAAMTAEYGRQYINLREYMSTSALSDAQLEPTEEDLEYMADGMTPPSLLVDKTHFNSIGYELIGAALYKRMEELGYFDAVKAAINDAMVNLQ